MLLADLLEAIRDAHTPRTLARAIAQCLSRYAPVTRVVLGSPPISIMEAVGDHWLPAESPGTVTSIVPGLAIATRGRVPAMFADPDVCRALAALVDLALDHIGVVQRVAELSRRAHITTRELRDEQREPTHIVARSAVMRNVLERATLVARHPTTVLLTGESGTGKELVAREIHRLSPRAHRPLVQINCGAIPESLVESELFGYERGAFTGADRARAGVFERAHRGTLFLDEIGELPLAAQAKLLRVLQHGAIRRVGGTAETQIDVRVIAATNRSLPQMVRDGLFREDLYYRIHVFAIALPPLRERREDLAPLVHQLAAEISGRLGIAVPPISRATMRRIESYAWPGNVRELANVLEAALITGEPIELPAAASSSTRFDTAIRGAIEATLRATRGKIYGADGAAARLGLPPATLQSKMRKLGIERGRFVRGMS